MQARHLLITSSEDSFSEGYQRRHGPAVARINADAEVLDDVVMCANGAICDGILFEDIESIYWRKPFMPDGQVRPDTASYERSQRRYVLKSLCRLAQRAGKWLMVDPDYDALVPRAVQLMEASRHFRVPDWQMGAGSRVDARADRVVKSLVAHSVGDSGGMSTQRIPQRSTLAPNFTWYVQDCIQASHDVTVVFCCGRHWAFALDRQDLGDEVDWRLFGRNHHSKPWKSTSLSASEVDSVAAFMRGLDLNFGRIDLLRDNKGSLWFLEVNANGQFGWLDADGQGGMHDWVFDCARRRPIQ